MQNNVKLRGLACALLNSLLEYHWLGNALYRCLCLIALSSSYLSDWTLRSSWLGRLRISTGYLILTCLWFAGVSGDTIQPRLLPALLLALIFRYFDIHLSASQTLYYLATTRYTLILIDVAVLGRIRIEAAASVYFGYYFLVVILILFGFRWTSLSESGRYNIIWTFTCASIATITYFVPSLSHRLSKLTTWALHVYALPDTLRVYLLSSLQWLEDPICRLVEDAILQRSPLHEYNEQLEQDEVRLLVLAKRKLGQPPQVRLVRQSLANKPDFVACSYVWGDASPTRVVEVVVGAKSAHLRVTESFFSVLYREQSFTHETALWIDAVCINQTDPAEKSEQVAMMTLIYSHASSVHAHLDTSLQGSTLYAWLYFANYQTTFWLTDLFARTIATNYKLTGTQDSQHLAKAIYDLFATPWFRRAWILQEAVVPRRLVLRHQNVSIEWDQFVKLMDSLTVDWPEMSVRSGDKTLIHDLSTVTANFDRASRMIATRREWQRKGSRPPLRTLLDRFRTAEATEPRDRIFALLGITNGEHQVSIDYTLSVKEVYTSAVVSIMREDISLHFMSTDGFLCPASVSAELPSWLCVRDDEHAHSSKPWLAPVWKSRGKWVFSGGPSDYLMPHAIFRPPEPPFRIRDTYCLEICGFALGSVQSVVPYVEFSGTHQDVQYQLHDLLRQQWNLAERWWCGFLDQYPETEQEFRNAFWETLVLGRFDSEERAVRKEDHDLAFRTFDRYFYITVSSKESESRGPPSENDIHWREDMGPGSLQGDLDLVNLELIRTLQGRIFGCSDTGSLLLLPRDARQNDLLVRCRYASTPFVLRLVDDIGLSSEIPTYQFVGPCFIHGDLFDQVKSALTDDTPKTFLLT